MSPMRVLIVDDHAVVRRGIRGIVEACADCVVCGEAADGLEAVAKASELRPDLVLMDIMMPRMNGFEATRMIQQYLPETEVILVSQEDPAIVRSQMDKLNARAFVPKSMLADELIPEIEKVIEEKRQRKIGTAGKWVQGGSMLGRLIANFDWAKTPIGPLDEWPQSLRNSVNLMLNSQHPMWIGWGDDMTFLYNDAYISVLSLAKHPWALGRPAREVWTEIWDICGPMADKVFAKGEPTFVDDVRLFMSRGDRLEETYYSFSYSPIFNESGTVAGLFCPSSERTAAILNTRRLRTLAELSAKALMEKSIESACASVLTTLARNPDDIPFTLLYLLDEDATTAKLQGTAGMGNLATIATETVELDGAVEEQWPIREVFRAGKVKVLALPKAGAMPTGPAEQPVKEAIVLPVASTMQVAPIGFLVCGVNPTRVLDVEYTTFFSLVVDQLLSAIGNARASEDEKKQAERLAEIDRAKTAFFSNLSHEFRTPITLMLGPVEELLEKPQERTTERERELLGIVQRNGLRLQKMVNALLDFSRIEATRMHATFQPTDLCKLTIELASNFRSAIERAGMKLVVDCQEMEEPVYVDPEMWEKIVLNLLSNAFKFTFEGKIEVRLRSNGNCAVLTVRDTGIGVAEEEMHRLFERFHRIEGTRARTHEGSGIGLALVQELVRIHGGEITATSKVGEGTAFTISLPLGQKHLAAERIADTADAKKTGRQSTAFVNEAMEWIGERTQPLTAEIESEKEERDPRIRILLADDNADMRNYVSRLLGARWAVETVEDGEKALESIRKAPPTLLITDVMMPGLDGFELLQEIRKDPALRKIPVMMLSARAGDEARMEGLEAGADDYVVKPFTARELIARVASRLDLHRLGTLLERERASIDNLFRQTPVPIAVLSGPELIYTVANAAYREIVGGRDIVGKPILEALPELRGQGFDTLAQEVMRTGNSYIGREALVKLNRAGTGELEDTYFTFIYSALGKESGINHSVIAICSEVTDQVRAREQLRKAAEEASSGQEKFKKLSESLEAEVRNRTNELEMRNKEVLGQADQLRDLSVRLLKAQDEERRRIARELHDSSGQTLAALGMNLSRLGRDAENGTQAIVDESMQMVRQLTQEIRTTSYLLHPPMLDETGLEGALRWYVRGIVERGGIDIRLEIPEDLKRLPRDMELVIFRVVQEALTNIHRHSGSKTAEIRISCGETNVEVAVQDWGRGIPAERLVEIQTKGSGVGFRGMRERVRQLRGEMNVGSGEDGTKIVVSFPI